MKLRPFFVSLTILICVLVTLSQSTEITYQGSLRDGANLASGNFDFEFALFDAGGTQLGTTQSRNGVAVVSGIFSVKLDFGNQFPGADRLLEIRVRPSGGGSFTPLSPRQSISSSPYSVKSLNSENATSAANATNATNAQNAVTFSGTLGGDVTGSQSNTTVAGLRGRNVAATLPNNGQVLKFNTATSQWEPANDETASAGGGGTITGVTAGTGLTGGGTSGSVTVGIANGGVTNALLADGSVNTAKLADSSINTSKMADASVTNAKIVDVAGSKITGSITTATIPGANVSSAVASAATAGNFSGPLAGDVTGTQGATVIANNAVTAAKIANGEVVKSINSLKDNVTLAAGSNVTITPSGNTLTIAATGGGAGNPIQNQTTQQTGANFNIDGTGTANSFNAVTQYNIGGLRVVGTPGTNNLFIGTGAGQAGSSGNSNTFVGAGAGQFGGAGTSNVYVGASAGLQNSAGGSNTFLGSFAGNAYTTGNGNIAIGANSALSVTSGISNIHIGNDGTAGDSQVIRIGSSQTDTFLTGTINGNGAGLTNLNGGNLTNGSVTSAKIADGTITASDIATGQVVTGINSLKNDVTLAAGSNITITPSGNTLTIASSGGAVNAILNQTTTQAGANFNISGDGTAGGILRANFVSSSNGEFRFGTSRFFAGDAIGNLRLGLFSGEALTGGSFDNTFLGQDSGSATNTGDRNVFIGAQAGSNNTGGSDNTALGYNAGVNSGSLTNATAIGNSALVSQSNSLILGSINGVNGAASDTNIGIGTTAPNHRLTVGPAETPLVTTAAFGIYGNGPTYSIVRDATNNVEGLIGAEAGAPGAVLVGSVTNHQLRFRTNNTDRMSIFTTGEVVINTLGGAGATQLCRNATNQISSCSSSRRYKTNIEEFGSGLSFVNRLRPISFDWLNGGQKDVGFVAEDLAKIDERFVTYNDKGEVEGIKYDRLTTVLVNTAREQQDLIEGQRRKLEKQQKEIDGLKKALCSIAKDADICRQL